MQLFSTSSAKPPSYLNLFFATSFSAYFLYILYIQFGYITDLRLVHEEFRLLFIQHRLAEPHLFSGDFLAQTLEAYGKPVFYQWINTFWIKTVGVPLFVYHHSLPIILYTIFLTCMGITGYKMAGPRGALFTLLFSAAIPEFLNTMAATQPHSYAYPLLSAFMAALLYNRKHLMALITILAGGLYSPAAVVCGITLSGWFLSSQTLFTGPRKQRVYHFLLLGGTGIITLTLSYLAARNSFDSNHARDFNGWYKHTVFIFYRIAEQFQPWLGGSVKMAPVCVLILFLLGLMQLPEKAGYRLAIRIFLFGTFGSWLLVSLFFPQLSYRLLFYSLLTLLPMTLPGGLEKLASIISRVPYRQYVFILLIGTLLAMLSSTNRERNGYWYLEALHDPKLHKTVESIPEHALTAGWPDSRNPVNELLPYYFKRPTFILFKFLFPINQEYMAQMNARFEDFVSAYFSSDQAPIETLYRKWGVHYLIIHKPHFRKDATMPSYPDYLDFLHILNEKTTRAWNDNVNKGFLLASPPPHSILYENENIFIISLEALLGNSRVSK